MTGNQSNKELIGNLKSLLTFGSNNANKNVITDSNGDLAVVTLESQLEDIVDDLINEAQQQ